MIPKIIHFTTPDKREQWHPVWDVCFESWKDHFPETEYTYMLWTDDKIYNFVQNYYPEYYDIFHNLPFYIMKLDFFRFCVLSKIGGIYSDLDMYCYKNFYEDLTQDCYFLETFSSPEKECIVLNSLFCSAPNTDVFKKCVEESINNFLKISVKKPWCDIKIHTDRGFNIFIHGTFGSFFLTKFYKKYNNQISLLDKKLYNNHILTYSPDYVTKHMCTGMWSKKFLEIDDAKNVMKNIYIKHREINIDEFDFKRNYIPNVWI